MTQDDLRDWQRIFQTAYEQAERFPGDSQAVITAKVLFSCLTAAAYKTIAAKDFDK